MGFIFAVAFILPAFGLTISLHAAEQAQGPSASSLPYAIRRGAVRCA